MAFSKLAPYMFIFCLIWGIGVTFRSDSTTGLTAEEKQIIADSFSSLKQDLPGNGQRLFIIFFTYYPENKKYFRNFENKTIAELENSELLRYHGTRVMNSINGIIKLLNEPQKLVADVTKIGCGHGKRNIADQAFIDLKNALVKLLQEKLNNPTPKIIQVWGKAYDIIISVFKQGMKNCK